MVSALVAAEDRKIEALILLAAVFDMEILKDISSLLTPFKDWKEKGYAYFKSSSKKMTVKVGYEFYREATSHDMAKTAARINCPTSILHGANDESVPLKHSKFYYDNLSGEKKLVIIEGARHTFKEEVHLKRAKEEIREWLGGRLTVY